jgi:drug/metabolite transporter (DMT)-like permease
MTAPNKKTASTPMVVLAFATVYVVWGSTYFFIQKALNGFPPFILGAIRFIIAGLLMLAWSLFRGEKIWDIRQIKFAALTGILLLFIGNGIVIWVEQFMPSAMVAIMVSSSPIWFIVLDKPKWKENFRSKATIAGLIFGFVGVLVLFSEKIIAVMSTFGKPAELWGMLLITVGAMSWAGGSLYSKYKSVDAPATVTSTWQMLAAGVAFLPLSLLRGEASQIQWGNIPADAWLALWYLIFFGSIAGFSAYVWLLQVRPATQVSTYAYVNPVVAVLLGVFFAHEHITVLQVLGLAIILTSVFMINLVKYKSSKAAEQAADPQLNLSTPQKEDPVHASKVAVLD